MTQDSMTPIPDCNNGLSPTATHQVLASLIAGLEDLGDAIAILLPLFRSLAYRDSSDSVDDLSADLLGGDSDLILSIYDCWTNAVPDPQAGLALLQVLFRSTALQEKAELKQRLQSQQKHTIPLTWHADNPLAEKLTDTQGEADLAELAIHKAQHAQMLLFKAKFILECAADSTAKRRGIPSADP